MRAGVQARKEQGAGDGSRPGDVFFPRFSGDGPLAVDITVRHTLAPSNPVAAGSRLAAWFDRQAEEKSRKYAPACGRLGWRFSAFVVDCYGAVGPDALRLMQELVHSVQGQRSRHQWREIEASTWQGLGVTVANEIGQQLSLSSLAG